MKRLAAHVVNAFAFAGLALMVLVLWFLSSIADLPDEDSLS